MNTRTAPQRVKLDDQEFLAFYQEHFISIYRFIYRKVGSQEEAEDLTSQVFMKALRHLDYEYNTQKMRSLAPPPCAPTIISPSPVPGSIVSRPQ